MQPEYFRQDRTVVLFALVLQAAQHLAHSLFQLYKSSYKQEQLGLGKGRGNSDSLLRLLPMKTSGLDPKKRGQIKQ